MNDFITLSCPSCGGHLKIESNKTSYVCDFCGQKHILRKEDIESYCRCPICKRNDKVEKISAIIHRRDALAQRFIPPSNPCDSLIHPQKSEPIYLPEPEYIKFEEVNGKITSIGLGLLGISIVIFFILLVLFVNLSVNPHSPGWKFFLYLLLIINFIVFVYCSYLIHKGKKEDKQVNHVNKAEIDKKNIQINLEWKHKNKVLHDKWLKFNERLESDFAYNRNSLLTKHKYAMKRFRQLYYCYRDDCLFIPGEEIGVPPSKLNVLLQQSNDK